MRNEDVMTIRPVRPLGQRSPPGWLALIPALPMIFIGVGALSAGMWSFSLFFLPGGVGFLLLFLLGLFRSREAGVIHIDRCERQLSLVEATGAEVTVTIDAPRHVLVEEISVFRFGCYWRAILVTDGAMVDLGLRARFRRKMVRLATPAARFLRVPIYCLRHTAEPPASGYRVIDDVACRFDPYEGAPPPDVARQWGSRLDYPAYREVTRPAEGPPRRHWWAMSLRELAAQARANRWTIVGRSFLLVLCVAGLMTPAFYNMNLVIPPVGRSEVSTGPLHFTSTGPFSYALSIVEAGGSVRLDCGPMSGRIDSCVAKKRWRELNGKSARVEWYRRHAGPGIWRNRVLSVSVDGAVVVTRERTTRWLERQRDEGEVLFYTSVVLVLLLLGYDLVPWRRWRD
ncbi:hypothetical protein [Endothiovibrio diazotrophicus]